MTKLDYEFRLLDFHYKNEKPEENSDSSNSDEKPTKYTDNAQFKIQVFGINEKGETCSILLNNYLPFFYIKVENDWTDNRVKLFSEHIKNTIGKYYYKSVVSVKLVRKKKLYGFDGGKLKKLSNDYLLIKSVKGDYGPVEDSHLIINHILAHWFQKILKSKK